MNVVEPLFVAFNTGLTLVGLAIVWVAVRAYRATERKGLIHLSVGFTLLVAATLATTFSALITDFANARTMLVVDSGFSMAGYVFVVYSILSYE